MSLKVQSLGRCTSAAAGITMSGGTNATPIVTTVGAGHGLKNGDRVAISGVTGLTAMNGIWTVSAVGATAATLDGSVGNGTYGGTAAVAVVMDRTPFMRGHRAAVAVGNVSGSAVFVGTCLVEGSDQTDEGWLASPTYSDVVNVNGQAALVAATAGITALREITLARFMRFRASAYTSGGVECNIVS